MTPLRVFIGFDARESLAYHVLAHSILSRASIPVSITPLVRHGLASMHSRPRGEKESTDFSLTRFLVPCLSGYEGVSVYLDCDMLCLADVQEIIAAARFHDAVGASMASVFVVKHDYTPAATTKFLGQSQTAYPRKNWSSAMVFRNYRCRMLTPEYVNQASGLELHRFLWLRDEQIGALPREWNHLVGEANQSADLPKIVHFTNGGPWFEGYETVDYAGLWLAEKKAMGA